MVFLRSLAFNVFFYVHTIFWLFALLPTEILPKAIFWKGVETWARINRWAITAIAGVKVEIRGLENLPKGGALIAAKHHSTFETVSLIDFFDRPSFVMKKELRKIPLFGWYTIKGEQISVDRSAGRTALADMTERARREAARGRQILIFPEGTRRPAGAEPHYKHGIAHLYEKLGVPMVPVALNSGLFWGRHDFLRHPGTLVVEFLPAIPPGRDPEEVFAELQVVIETATDRLIAEALAASDPPPLPAAGKAYLARAAAKSSS
ncbi:lysophospholipid acyltransferase family protein [Pinisolibacter sp.]|uniref:lysophospholipid acyltransferase family protein n=1 Tax=Pinisolibacter sp. TaxID=2172024 RepID=UPI002FDE0828